MQSKSNPMINVDPQTPLAALGLPYIDVVLTERFLLPPEALRKIGEPVPETLEQLVSASGMPIEEIWAIICECKELDQNLRVEVQDLSEELRKDGVLLLDMRPGVTIESEPMHPSARLFHTQNPQNFLPYLRTLDRVFVLSHSGSHAWSAAVSLKKLGIKAVIPVMS